MTRLVSIITVVIIVAVTACSHSHSHFRDQLAELERSVDSSPDSVLNYLIGMSGDVAKEPEEDRMLYELLKIKALDKADKLPTTDTAIIKVINYFIAGKDSLHMAEALFYGGRTYSDMDHHALAIECYEKALDIFPKNGCDSTAWHLNSLIEAHLAWSYKKIKNLEMALMHGRKALSADIESGDSAFLIHHTLILSQNFQSAEMMDSALIYARRGLDICKSMSPQPYLTGDAYIHLADRYREFELYDSARVVLELGKKVLRPEKLNSAWFHYIAGYIYLRTHELDSTEVYYRKLCESGSLSQKRTAYYVLSSLALDTKDIKRSLDLITESHRLSDSLANKESQPTHFDQIEFSIIDKRSPRDSVWSNGFGMGIIAILLVALASVVIFKYRKRGDLTASQPMPKKNLYTSPVVNASHRMAAEGKPLPKEHIDSLIAELDAAFDGFRTSVGRYILLNPTQYSVSIMTKAGFQPSEIATLLSLSTSTISSMRGRLYQKAFGGPASSAKWDEFIMGL